jgi:nucleotide-binding universal stress UspA family protein
MYQKIVVCIDDTPLSERVARVGADLACRYDADIVLLSIFDPSRIAEQAYTGLEAVQMLEKHNRSLKDCSNRMDSLLHEMGVRTRRVMLPGRSVDTILEVAEREEADLIVMGTKARGRFHAWLTSDLWSEVSHKASCSVLRVTPPDWSDEAEKGKPKRVAKEKRVLTTPVSAL